MSGSLQKKNGIYHVVTYINKKPKWKTTGIPVAGNNLRKAQKRMREILTELEQQKIDNILLADYIKLWLEKKKHEVELNTWETYEIYVNTIIEPYFKEKELKLQHTNTQDIKTFFSYLQYGSNKHLPYSVESIKKYRVCLNGAFKMAMENDLIVSNPVERASLKKPPKDKTFKGDFYLADEANLLLEILREDPLLPVVQLTMFYGLRRSEVVGLRWSAVDFKNDLIRIQRTVVQTKTLIDKKRTKNKKSFRSMPLTPSIKDMLIRLKKEQNQNQLLMGKDYIQSDYICRLADGTPMKPNYVTQRFGRVLKKNADKIKRVRFHDLRHTAASLLLAEEFTLQQIQSW